jgi:hypothetical protein
MATSNRYEKPFDLRTWFPSDYPIDNPDYVKIIALLTRQVGSLIFRRHQTYRRRERWAVEAPLGTFTGDFARATHQAECDALWTLLEAAKKRKETGRVYPFTPSQQIFYVEDRIFLREHAVSGLSSLMGDVTHPCALLMYTLHRYHTALVAGDVSVFPPSTKPFVPLEQRPVINGHRARGPAWTVAEDAVLRSFFGRQPNGNRTVLSEAHWNMILNHPALKGRRTKSGLLQRINFLNCVLKKSLMVEGYLSAEGLLKWQQQRLGQRNRVPRSRVRLDGPYLGVQAKAELARQEKIKAAKKAAKLTPPQPPPSPSTPETPSADSATPAPSPAQTAS